MPSEGVHDEFSLLDNYFAPDMGAKYCGECVCLYIWHVSETTHLNFTEFSVLVNCSLQGFVTVFWVSGTASSL